MGPLQDSLQSNFESLKESAVTMQAGGGIGCDFSPLRPAGSPALSSGAIASGPVSFMHSWNTMCETLLGTSSRGGAMMATLRCDHPDIEAFVDAKRQPDVLQNFNLSVLLTDDFMRACAANTDWELKFPCAGSTVCNSGVEPISRKLPARQLWTKIVNAAHASAEPGVLFLDTINRNNNLWYCEQISATNPCGEIPLPPYGACDLGSINLTALVREPFTRFARLDRQLLRKIVNVAVRFLDDIIDISHFPLPLQAEQARNTRRIGLGVCGLADMLVMLGLHYDSEAARTLASGTLCLIRDTAYSASIALAREKSPFPSLDPAQYLRAPFIRRLPERHQADIADYGIRNSHLLAIAPTGTVSLLAGNISAGIEPIYALEVQREPRR
jgi:ribonucleoside-diphosphate reductase alpha chain